MQQTFEINANHPQRVIAELAKFGHRKVKVMIDDMETDSLDQKALAKDVLALRERFKHTKVDPNLDLSALANEMLGE